MIRLTSDSPSRVAAMAVFIAVGAVYFTVDGPVGLAVICWTTFVLLAASAWVSHRSDDGRGHSDATGGAPPADSARRLTIWAGVYAAGAAVAFLAGWSAVGVVILIAGVGIALAAMKAYRDRDR